MAGGNARRCPLCGGRARIRMMSVPPMPPITYAVESSECRDGTIFFDGHAYSEITRGDLPRGDEIRSALRARVKMDASFGTFTNPITMADLRAPGKAA